MEWRDKLHLKFQLLQFKLLFGETKLGYHCALCAAKNCVQVRLASHQSVALVRRLKRFL